MGVGVWKASEFGPHYGLGYMPKKRNERGRPRTGRAPMIGVRLPVPMIKKIGKIAEALSTNRSGTPIKN